MSDVSGSSYLSNTGSSILTKGDVERDVYWQVGRERGRSSWALALALVLTVAFVRRGSFSL